MAIQVNQFIDSLQEPYKLLCYLGLYVGIPILCIVLYFLDKKLTKIKYVKKSKQNIVK